MYLVERIWTHFSKEKTGKVRYNLGIDSVNAGYKVLI